MARERTQYVCQQCGAVYPRWQGFCGACGAGNSIVEEAPPRATPGGLKGKKGKAPSFTTLNADGADAPRIQCGIAEFDRVLGGGLVPGSAVLIAGDPGIGKSTLLLQASAHFARQGVATVYISGEEAAQQIAMRARRLGLSDAPVGLATVNAIGDVLAGLETLSTPAVAVIDSIQTMFVDTLESAPGTVAQVRVSTQELIRLAKRRGISLCIVGHVTKDGQIAGPRVLEHMVDTVLYFEGERSHQFRILRAVKNRYGPTDEIGVFEMSDGGLHEVANPSALFLGERGEPVSGTAVFAGMEGTRPILVEVQALVGPSPLGTPRRTVVGWDSARLAMVLAVLDTRAGLAIGMNDVYLNIAGGLRIAEPAVDLAVAAALVSSFFDAPMPAETVTFGEISLSGEIRRVAQSEQRLKEAMKLGFDNAIVPKGMRQRVAGIGATEIGHLAELVDMLREKSADTGAGHRAAR